jgi:hypothetical protein
LSALCRNKKKEHGEQEAIELFDPTRRTPTKKKKEKKMWHDMAQSMTDKTDRRRERKMALLGKVGLFFDSRA